MIKKMIAVCLALNVICSFLPSVSAANTGQIDGEAELRTAESYEITGTGSVGGMLAKLMEESEGENSGENAVSGLTITGTEAEITYHCGSEAVLFAAVYDEDSQRMIASASTEVSPEEETAVVTFRTAIPEHFTAAAFLTEKGSFLPLCAKYTTNRYTSAMQELEEASVSDFQEEQVLNLDDSTDTNFLVYDEGVTQIQTSETVNSVTYDDGVCTIGNADNSVKSLKSGDIFTYMDEEGDVVILRAKEVRTSGGTVVITEDENLDLEDAFSVIKIDSTAAEGSPVLMDDNAGQTGFSASATINFNKSSSDSSLKVSGSFTVEAAVKIYHTKKYTDAEVRFNNKINGSFTFLGRAVNPEPIPIAKEISLKPIAGVKVKLTPTFVFKASSGVTGEIEARNSVGIRYESGQGWVPIGEDVQVTKFQMGSNVSVFIGVGLKPEVDCLYHRGKVFSGGLLSATLDAAAGFEATMVGVHYKAGETAEDALAHDCDRCMDGDIKFKVDVSVKIESSLLELKIIPLDSSIGVKLASISVKLGDFYISTREGKTAFGWGKCPYIRDEVYAVLYNDGTLSIQRGKIPLRGAGTGTVYELDMTRIYEYNNDDLIGVPWIDRSEEIQTVEFVAEIHPLYTAGWFSNCSNLKTVRNIRNLRTEKTLSMREMFSYCENLTELDVSGFETSNVTDMSSMFSECENLVKLDVSGFDTSSVTNMMDMFWSCKNLTELDVSGFDTSNVTNMLGMLAECGSLTKLDVSGFDTSNVTSMADMFGWCKSLTKLDVSGFDTSNVTEMYGMFYGCENLIELDVSNFDTSNTPEMLRMFQGCKKLRTIYASTRFVVSSNVSMFFDCTALSGGNGTRYSADHTGSDYAHIDGGPSNPGYFTAKR